MTNDSHELTPDKEIKGADKIYITIQDSHKVTKVNDLMVIDKSDSVAKAEAIARVKEIQEEITPGIKKSDDPFDYYPRIGAIDELIRLFSITEEDLK